ncbi:hypothetical protein BGZ82_003406 [Podila clonocystis]|nr:hypothetical protein BGZ82_003406 [Podila clonocystis]
MREFTTIHTALNDLLQGVSNNTLTATETEAAAIRIADFTRILTCSEEADYATSLLLDESQESVVSLLRQTLSHNDKVAAKVLFVDLLGEFAKRWPSAVTKFAVPLINLCQELFSYDQAQTVKQATTTLLTTLIPLCQEDRENTSTEYSHITALFRTLYAAYGSAVSPPIQVPAAQITTLAETLQVLGMVAKYHPTSISSGSRSLLDICLGLGVPSGGVHQNAVLAIGALKCLDSCLYSISEKLKSLELMDLLKRVMEFIDQPSTHGIWTAAFDIFSHHPRLFNAHMMHLEEIQWFFKTTSMLCCHPEHMVMACGFRVLDIFLKEVSYTVTGSLIAENEKRQILQIFLDPDKTLQEHNTGSETRYKAMSVAIRGFGYFAAPCRKICPDQLHMLVTHLLDKSGFLMSSNVDDGLDGSYSHLLALITSFTYVGLVHDELSELLLSALSQVANAAVVNFTKVSTQSRIDCTLAIERLLIMLFYKGEGVLRSFFDCLCYKWLVFTSSDISKPIIPTADQQAPVGYTGYQFLWQNIFSPSTLSKDMDLSEVLIRDKDKEVFLRTLYASVMLSFRRLVSLLNLSVSDAHTDLEADDADRRIQDIGTLLAPASGKGGSMQANNVKDFTILQNLTEFWQKFLPKTCPKLFGRWAFLIGDCLIELSAKNPLESGFYKMFATCIQVCLSTQYFDQLYNVPKVKMEETSRVEIQRTKSLFSKYIAAVAARLEQYKDDLLATCLHLVLSTPTDLADFNNTVRAIQLALKLEHEDVSLAFEGYEAIVRLMTIDHEDPEPLLQRVVPNLIECIAVQDLGMREDDEARSPPGKSVLAVNGDKPSRLSILYNSKVTTSEQHQMLKGLKDRVYRFLADNYALVKIIHESTTAMVGNEILPRAADIAENSLVRQARVSSCELLHAIVLEAIRHEVCSREPKRGPTKNSFYEMSTRVMPLILRLAADTDGILGLLFRTLLTQLIHWLASSGPPTKKIAELLLDCCFVAASDASPTLQKIGVLSVKEFVASLEKLEMEDMEGYRGEMWEYVTDKIEESAKCANPHGRLGASFIVIGIDRAFNTRASLFKMFTHKLLVSVLASFRIAESSDHPSLATKRQACAAIEILKTTINTTLEVFVVGEEGKASILETLVLWLMKETARPEAEYTKMCWRLLDNFIKLLPGSSSTGTWVEARLERDPKFLSKIYNTLDWEGKTFTGPASYHAWCAQLASILTNYTQMLQQTGTSDHLMKHLKASPILALTVKFLEKCLLLTENVLSQQHKETTLTSQERRKFQQQNFVTARKSIAFVTALISKDKDGSIVHCLQESHLLSGQFYTVFATCLFEPHRFGYDSLLSEEEIKTFSEELQSVLETLKAAAETKTVKDAKITQELGQKMRGYLFREDLSPLLISIDVLPGRDAFKNIAFLDGIAILSRSDAWSIVYGSNQESRDSFLWLLFITFKSLYMTEDPAWICYCQRILNILHSEDKFHEKLWNFVLCPGGILAFQLYKDDVSLSLLHCIKSVAGVVEQEANNSNPSLPKIFCELMDFLVAKPELVTQRSDFLSLFEEVVAQALMATMPSTTAEYERGGSRLKDYISSLDMLLKSLIASTNIALFKLLMGIAIRDSNHPHMEQMQRSIVLFALKLPLSKLLNTTNFCFKSFMERDQLSIEHRCSIVRQILLPILKIVPILSVCAFFKTNIIQIIDVSKTANSRTSIETHIESECAFALLSLLYVRLPADMVNTKDSDIVQAFTGGNVTCGEELTTAVINAARAACFKSDKTKYKFKQDLGGPMTQEKVNNLRSRCLDPTKSVNAYRTLELDSINANPCMKMIVQVVNELHARISPPPAATTEEVDEMPFWVRSLHDKIVDQNTRLNVRLYLAKIIVNVPYAFEAYASSWLRPLMELAIEGESYGEAMNSFVHELCVLVVVWGKSVGLQDSDKNRKIIANFMKYLMRNCYHESSSCLLNNIYLIKNMFDNWPSVTSGLIDIVYENIKSGQGEKRSVAGLQLMKSMLAHRSPALCIGGDINHGHLDPDTFQDILLQNFSSSYDVVYTSVSEVCGMILALTKEHNSSNSVFLDCVALKMKNLWEASTESKNNKDRFVRCAHLVQFYYPDIITTCVSDDKEMTGDRAGDTTTNTVGEMVGQWIVYEFASLLDDEKTMALEILAGSVDHLENLSQSLQALNFMECLKHEDERIQFSALSVIYGLRDVLKEDQIQYFLETLVAEFPSHSSIECRKLYYSVLMILFEKFAGSTLMGDTIRTQLLVGSGDSSESIRLTVVEFLDKKSGESTSPLKKLSYMLRNMYDPQNEHLFLKCATYLLLNCAKSSAAFNFSKSIAPLPNATFSGSLQFDLSWQDTRQFAHTQHLQVVDNLGPLGAEERDSDHLLFDFNLALKGGMQSIRFQLDGQAGMSSAVLFKSGPNPDQAALSAQEVVAPSHEYQRLQDPNTNSSTSITTSHFVRTDEELAKTRSIVMSREYRDSDLPDIEIRTKDTILPLQALAQMDDEVSRMAFTTVVTAALLDAKALQSTGLIDTLVHEIVCGMVHLLERSTMKNSCLTRAILEIFYNVDLELPIEIIEKIGTTGSNPYLALLLVQQHQERLDKEKEEGKRLHKQKKARIEE